MECGRLSWRFQKKMEQNTSGDPRGWSPVSGAFKKKKEQNTAGDPRRFFISHDQYQAFGVPPI